MEVLKTENERLREFVQKVRQHSSAGYWMEYELDALDLEISGAAQQ